ncbi:MAG: 6-carboxytetrahydropterin synthase [Candidatus Thorarchaeota archaeon]
MAHEIYVTHPAMGFSSAHFVVSNTEVEPLHGHNYIVSVRVRGDLNSEGMVEDFRLVKRVVGEVCRGLDHRVLLPTRSELIQLDVGNDSVIVRVAGKQYVFPREDCVLLPVTATTVECLAEYIAGQIVLRPELSLEVCVSENDGSRGCFLTQASEEH